MCVILRTTLKRRPVALGKHVRSTNRQICSLRAWHVSLISSCWSSRLSARLTVCLLRYSMCYDEWAYFNSRGGALVQSHSPERVITLWRAALSTLQGDGHALLLLRYTCADELHTLLLRVLTGRFTFTYSKALTYTQQTASLQAPGRQHCDPRVW